MDRYTGIRAKGAGIEIRFSVEGQQHSVYIAQNPTPSNLADAARYRRQLIQQAKLGEEIREPSALNPTFQEACNTFLGDRKTDLQPSTLVGYRQALICRWSELGHMSMRDIRLPHIRKIDRAQQWRSQKTRRNAHSILKNLFRWALEEDIIDANPAANLGSGKWQKPEIDAFSRDEKGLILGKLRGKYRVFYTIMFETGARTGEVQALRWSDFRGDVLRIERSMFKGKIGPTKNHAMRDVLLTEPVKQALERFTETKFSGGHIFLNSSGDPFGYDRSLTLQFKAACKAAEVRYRRPYNARHTYATLALMAGCKEGFVANQMGDRLETVLRHYATWLRGDADQEQLAILNAQEAE